MTAPSCQIGRKRLQSVARVAARKAHLAACLAVPLEANEQSHPPRSRHRHHLHRHHHVSQPLEPVSLRTGWLPEARRRHTSPPSARVRSSTPPDSCSEPTPNVRPQGSGAGREAEAAALWRAEQTSPRLVPASPQGLSRSLPRPQSVAAAAAGLATWIAGSVVSTVRSRDPLTSQWARKLHADRGKVTLISPPPFRRRRRARRRGRRWPG